MHIRVDGELRKSTCENPELFPPGPAANVHRASRLEMHLPILSGS